MSSIAQSQETTSTPSKSTSTPQGGSGGVQLKSALRGSPLDVQLSMLNPVQRQAPEVGTGVARLGGGPDAEAATTPPAPVQRREARSVQRMVVQREANGAPPAPAAAPAQAGGAPAPVAPAQAGGANTTAPGAPDPAAERQRKEGELRLKEAQLDELMTTLRQHAAGARAKWQTVKAGWSGISALGGGPYIALTAKAGGLLGMTVGGPLGAAIGAFAGAGVGLLASFSLNRKVNETLDQRMQDKVDEELTRIEVALATGDVNIDIQLCLDLIRTDASNVDWINSTIHDLVVHAERAKELERQAQEQIAQEAAAKQASVTDMAGNAADVAGNASDVGSGAIDAAKEALGSFGQLGPLFETVGNAADGLGVAIEGGRAALEIGTWATTKDRIPAARAEVDRLRAELQMPPLPAAGGGGGGT